MSSRRTPGPIRHGAQVYRRYPTPALSPMGRGVWVPAPDAQLRIWAGTTWVESSTHAFAISPRNSREFCHQRPALSNQRAQGRPGARCTRGLACNMCIRTRTRAYRFSGGIRPSLRSGFTAYFVLSPVNGLCCHRRHADRSTRLDASIGAPGPHDFAVRISHARQSQLSRPPHPTARS
jgi:hypothetical protein